MFVRKVILENFLARSQGNSHRLSALHFHWKSKLYNITVHWRSYLIHVTIERNGFLRNALISQVDMDISSYRSFCQQRIRSSGQGFRLVQIRNNIPKRTLLSAAICHFSGVKSYFTQTRNGVTEMTLLVSAELYMILRSVSNVVLLPS